MNPFVKTSAGLFAVVSPANASSELAQEICAALASKIATQQKEVIEAGIWRDAISNIPNLVEVRAGSNQATTLANGSLVAKPIAKLAAGLVSNKSAASKVEQGVSNYLSQLPVVNSFVLLLIEQGAKEISLNLLDTMIVETSKNTAVNVSSESFSLDTSKSGNVAKLDSIFENFTPLSTQPYYLPISL